MGFASDGLADQDGPNVGDGGDVCNQKLISLALGAGLVGISGAHISVTGGCVACVVFDAICCFVLTRSRLGALDSAQRRLLQRRRGVRQVHFHLLCRQLCAAARGAAAAGADGAVQLYERSELHDDGGVLHRHGRL